MTFRSKVRRTGYLLAVAVFAFAIYSAVRPQSVSAYGLLSSRSIKMSSSANGATNTAYSVGFTTVTAGQTVGSVVIKFCANNPIIGDACTAPTGFRTNFATLNLNTITGNITGLAINTTTSTDNVLLLTRTAGPVTNGAVTFILGNGTSNGITNPTNSNTTFYARILLFASSTPDITTPANESTATDAGGTALSTANVLNVTAKVQETLVFCVYTGANCGLGGSAVALGDGNGVLSDTTQTYTSTANFDLASNALAGVSVQLKGDTLTSGAFTIDPYTSGVCGADTIATNQERFGLRVSTIGASQTALAPYNCLAGNHGFDVTSTNTTYGNPIVTTAGATDKSTSTIELAAKAAGTTEAGIYTTTLQLIATAKY
jgi:hypothetical protein